MDELFNFTKTEISDEIRASSQPWLELDPNRDLTGLPPGDDVLFATLEEKTAHFRQNLFGKRFSTGAFLKPEREFHQMTYLKAEVPAGGKLLVICEALEPTGLVEIANEMLPKDAVMVPVEVRPYTKARGGEKRHWPLFRELAAPFADQEFDAVIASQTHHCDNYEHEFRALARILKPGGRMVLVDYGPLPSTFELAKQDVLLTWLLRNFVTWAGARRVPIERAYEYQKEIWLSAPMSEVRDACRDILVEPKLWESKGMAMVYGACKQS